MRCFCLAIALLLSGCAGARGLNPIEYRFLDVPEERRIEVVFHNYLGYTVCLSPDTWPNQAGKIDQASEYVFLMIDGRRFPIEDFNTGYCPGCWLQVSPGETVTASIPYSDFGVPKDLENLEKDLVLSPVACRCSATQLMSGTSDRLLLNRVVAELRRHKAQVKVQRQEALVEYGGSLLTHDVVTVDGIEYDIAADGGLRRVYIYTIDRNFSTPEGLTLDSTLQELLAITDGKAEQQQRDVMYPSFILSLRSGWSAVFSDDRSGPPQPDSKPIAFYRYLDLDRDRLDKLRL